MKSPPGLAVRRRGTTDHRSMKGSPWKQNSSPVCLKPATFARARARSWKNENLCSKAREALEQCGRVVQSSAFRLRFIANEKRKLKFEL